MQMTTTNNKASDLSQLNSQQLEAVTQSFGASLVIAGAGSGKTLVLTKRIAYLIEAMAQKPYNILAVTFTNKASNEMKHRIAKNLGESAVDMLSIGTFHSICGRILRRDIDKLDLPQISKLTSNFVIYNESDSLNIIKDILSKMNLDETVYNKKNIKFQISNWKADGIDFNKAIEKASNYHLEKVAQVYRLYQIELANNNALDFDCLIFNTFKLLQTNSEVLSYWQDKFKHILVDEFQDTSRSQYDLIKLLANHPNNDWQNSSLMAVGDIDQSIYSWRKADYRVVLDYQKEFKQIKTIKLEDNYRSCDTILKAANSIIVNNKQRIDKVLRCNRPKGDPIGLFEASNEAEEAHFIIDRIKRLKFDQKKLKDMVILYRTNAQSRAFEEAAFANKIPYKLIGANRFYDRSEIRDVMAYLKLIYNSRDNQSFLRAISNPKRGVGDVCLKKLEDYAVSNKMSFLEGCRNAELISDMTKKNQEGLKDFYNLIKTFSESLESIPLDEFIDNLVEQSGLKASFEKKATNEKNATNPMENIEELIASAREYVNDFADANLENYLTRVSLISDLDNIKDSDDTLSMMTIHLAKGMEYNHVFLVGLEEKTLPHLRSLESESELEEERRLMYVAVTRAKDQLYLSYCREKFVNFKAGESGRKGFNIATLPSRFLLEIDPSLFNRFNQPNKSLSYTQSSFDKNYNAQSNKKYESDIFKIQSSFKKQTQIDFAQDTNTNESSQIQSDDNNAFNINDLVVHEKFGTGKIVSAIGKVNKMYNISFNSVGMRLIDPRLTKLTKL